MIDKNLKVFLLEDLKTDQALVKRAVLKAVPNAIFTIASNRSEFLDKIKWVRPDIILSDYHLPDYNGLEALFYVKEHLPFLPFVFVSGTLNSEELAAQTIVKGASGYILKDNLTNLTEQLPQFLKAGEERMLAAKKEEKRRLREQLLLQKLQVKLSNAGPFPEKAELEEIVGEILEYGV